jgi:type IV pilus assembly protein PilB
MTNEQIQKILISGNYVSNEDMQAALAATGHGSLSEYLINQGIITRDILGQAAAEYHKIPYADLDSYPPSQDKVAQIPEDVARKRRIVLFREEKNKIIIATDSPEQADLSKYLHDLFKGKTATIAYALPEELDRIFAIYQKPLETRFSKIINENKRVAPEILDEIVRDAVAYHASDIHFEPTISDVVIRFRIDGVLQEAGRIKKQYYENILNRVKVQAKLRIDEHFSAQDGSIRYNNEGRSIDLRVSVIPTVEGEKIAIRVLAEYMQGFALSDLGLSKEDEKNIREAADKPFGMILVTGPTGSGKTTTLYALIKMLNQPQVNIMTIEDPVEYRIAGVNQIQVNTATNLTFAKGLRSIIRQDPDVVLVGEIRDTETAEIAVNAALTGHLMLSTFHANDAATAIPRLLNMNVEPFLLASTLELIVAQRLVRRICEHCRRSVTYSQSELTEKFEDAKNYFTGKTVTLYEGKGCEACSHTGYKGRLAVFEFIKVTAEIENLILENPASKQIWELARTQGTRSMFEDGIDKVKNGITTIDELLRVTEPPELGSKK